MSRPRRRHRFRPFPAVLRRKRAATANSECGNCDRAATGRSRYDGCTAAERHGAAWPQNAKPASAAQHGQFAHCNAPPFFATANQLIQAGKLNPPALGTANDGMTCPTVRDFSVVDQDQSDNVTTTYLAPRLHAQSAHEYMVRAQHHSRPRARQRHTALLPLNGTSGASSTPNILGMPPRAALGHPRPSENPVSPPAQWTPVGGDHPATRPTPLPVGPAGAQGAGRILAGRLPTPG
jgi:hypothetical protein